MQLRVVLVGPEYAMNIGYVCRLMKNFGFSELFLVNPKCDVRGIDAHKGAKHARGILLGARTVRSFRDAVKNCDEIIGTTGVKIRNKGTIRSAIGLREFAKMKGAYKNKKIALVFGREGIGLKEDELNECDLLVHVEASADYPVLNISHAAAIILYSLSSAKPSTGEKPASGKETAALKSIFSEISSRFERRNMRAPVAFRRVIARAGLNEHEAKALLNLLRLVRDSLPKKD